jgi:hypothetical protein
VTGCGGSNREQASTGDALSAPALNTNPTQPNDLANRTFRFLESTMARYEHSIAVRHAKSQAVPLSSRHGARAGCPCSRRS